MIRQFERWIYRALLSQGWSLQRARDRHGGWQSGRAYWETFYLRRWPFKPRTLIDAGVGNGTPSLYAAFPDAELVLIEPLDEFAPAIRKILSTRKGVSFPVALGRNDETRTFYIDPEYTERSSLFRKSPIEQPARIPASRAVRVTTLDQLAADNHFDPPYGLKIDAEGAELEIIEGARTVLRDCLFVIAEVSIAPRFEGSYQFAEFIAAMDGLGFAVCDLFDIGRAVTSEVTFVDLMFRRGTSKEI